MPTSIVECCDNMEFMSRFSDKFFDLIIADPEYGIGFDGQKESTSRHGGRKAYDFKGWDSERPDESYFNELFRISKNQVIWGANYFTKFLPPSMGWIFWDKGQRIQQSDGELAFSSFERALRVVTINRNKIQMYGGAIQPCQKPVELYKWVLSNYANPGFKIFDPNMGSQSSRIAAYDMGFDYWGCEIDPDYFKSGCERFEKECSHLNLFHLL